MEEYEWVNMFTRSTDPYSGYCETVEQAEDLIQMFSYETSTAYTAVRCSPNFGLFQITGI